MNAQEHTVVPRLPVPLAAGGRREHVDVLARARLERQIDLFGLALQLQEREEMGLIEYPRGHRQDCFHGSAMQLVRLEAEQPRKRGVHKDDRSVVPERRKSARRVVEQLRYVPREPIDHTHG